jgi:hypothetical protein
MSGRGLHPYNTKLMDDRTRNMILAPDSWPQCRLPLKKRGEGMQFGYLSRSQALTAAGCGRLNIFVDISQAHVRGVWYDSIEAALADGWTVD